MDVVETPAKAGWDIVTTIDAQIQDITERALRDKLVETDAESGTAIIMEVKSGEIKGIVNLDRVSEGRYVEGNPNAFSYMNEPGSTFKTVTVMVALDDGVAYRSFTWVTAFTSTTTGGSGITIGDGKIGATHGCRRDGGVVERGHEQNRAKGYEKNPTKFVEGIDRTYESSLPGTFP